MQQATYAECLKEFQSVARSKLFYVWHLESKQKKKKKENCPTFVDERKKIFLLFYLSLNQQLNTD